MCKHLYNSPTKNQNTIKRPPLRTKEKLHKPTVRTLTAHPRANVVCVETFLKFVLIPSRELALKRCHVDSRSNCKRKFIPQGHNTIVKRNPASPPVMGDSQIPHIGTFCVFLILF